MTARTANDQRFREFKMPDVGEGLTEAEILKWYVAVGGARGGGGVGVEGGKGKGGGGGADPVVGGVGEHGLP
ncbi:2-oxo acid dehydrogenase subunit E2, partial [Streptomyces roseifaciens]